jgi:hypothetical protein
MAMLSLAYIHAAPTETIAERPAPADVGGFVLDLSELHKVFANAGGTYIELDTNADHHYDATGLIRIHTKGVSPQLGPSDSVLTAPAYRVPDGSPKPANTGVGVSWQDANGQWHRLGELSPEQIKSVTVTPVVTTPERVAFDVTYQGELFGVAKITEHYEVTPGQVELSTELANYLGPLRYVWPVLASDGRTETTIASRANDIMVSRPSDPMTQTFEAPGAESVRLEAERYPNHNGWARLGIAEFPHGGKIQLRVRSDRQ